MTGHRRKRAEETPKRKRWLRWVLAAAVVLYATRPADDCAGPECGCVVVCLDVPGLAAGFGIVLPSAWSPPAGGDPHP